MKVKKAVSGGGHVFTVIRDRAEAINFKIDAGKKLYVKDNVFVKMLGEIDPTGLMITVHMTHTLKKKRWSPRHEMLVCAAVGPAHPLDGTDTFLGACELRIKAFSFKH